MSGKKVSVKSENAQGELPCVVFDEHLAKSKKGLVVIQEWWGMNEQIQKEAKDLADMGPFVTIVPDLYRGKLAKDNEEAGHLMNNLDWPGAVKDIKAAAFHLKTMGCTKVGVTGFCMGGALTLATAALEQDYIYAAAPFYGIPGETLCDVSTIKCPVQCHFGELDALEGFSSPKDAAKLEEKFKAKGVKYEMYKYPGANHAFTNYTGPNYNKEACDLALKRLTEFMNKNLLRIEERPHFHNRLGLICSCLGSVVGTGNIWRFPRILASNSEEKGGLVFLLAWVLFLVLWSSPMLLIEYGTGRYTRRAVIGSFRAILGEGAAWCGAWISMVTFLISCYYSVVLGWCLYYFVYMIANDLPETAEAGETIFKDFAEDSYWPVLTHALASLLAGLAVVKGVNTIEKTNMFLVPLLLLIILFTFVWSLTRDYADIGIKFLFTPHWESFGEPRLWVDALSQNAFDTGAGMGLMIPYASFMTVDNSIVKYGLFIPSINNLISLICGIMLFATVFSTMIALDPNISKPGILDIMKRSGPGSTGLTFIWIPVLFSTIGVFGRVLSVLFFACLSMAGITSLVANMEMVTHTLYDFGVPRKFGMPCTVTLTFLGGLASALNLDILTNQDFVWGFALVINGFFLQLMVIIYGTRKFRQNMFNSYSIGDWKLPRVWEWVVKIIAPLEALFIIGWWAYDLIDGDSGDGEKWYEFGRETLVITVVQWFALMVLLVSINMIYLCCRRRGDDETVKLLGRQVLQTSQEPEVSYKDVNL
ncbi:uncharacterized sodium-dependent transporter HI_0736-like [Saccostrea echinata]|uniref:uncharacterized sodium-dependent transporter HI_0736-like n=1 Tax=Saccostrea echinata TaxID=191078 RepID=UPI002A82CC7C|nr:uncharacterized sodium-dependent transporter HI_0736-like [Saccostrea echinata]